jgi:hypothetical protein
MNERVIEAMATSNSLRAPFGNTKSRLDGRERDVVGPDPTFVSPGAK